MVRLKSHAGSFEGGVGIQSELARQAAFELCRAVAPISPVRIQPKKNGGFDIIWESRVD